MLVRGGKIVVNVSEGKARRFCDYTRRSHVKYDLLPVWGFAEQKRVEHYIEYQERTSQSLKKRFLQFTTLRTMQVEEAEVKQGAVFAYKRIASAFGQAEEAKAQEALLSLWKNGAIGEEIYAALSLYRRSLDNSSMSSSYVNENKKIPLSVPYKFSSLSSSPPTASFSKTVFSVSDVKALRVSSTIIPKSTDRTQITVRGIADIIEAFQKVAQNAIPAMFVSISNHENFLDKERDAYHLLEFDFREGEFQLTDINGAHFRGRDSMETQEE